MSHYTVAVISYTGTEEEVTELLAPFDEGIEVEKYIYRTKEQIIEDGRERQEGILKRIQEYNKDELIEVLTSPSYDWYRRVLAAQTPQDFYDVEVNTDMVDEEGNEYSTYNPESRWDWWEIGGRWSGSLRDYNGEYHNTLKIADWDYNYINPDNIAYHSRFWEIAVEGAEPTEEEKSKYILWYKPEYYIEKYGNKSNYIKSMITFSAYALLTPDGEWLEPGKMGWWGVSHADPADHGKWERDFTSLIDTFDKDMYITIVDCHI